MSTIDEMRPSVENVPSQMEFETLFADISSRLINLRPEDVDSEIVNALRRVCEPLGIELAVLWQWSSLEPDVVVMPTHAYAKEGLQVPGPLHREQHLQASERRLAAGADIAGLAFYEIDFENGAIYVGDRFRDLFSIPADRERGLSALSFWMEHLHPDDRSNVLRLREELHSGKSEQLNVEYRYLNPTQGERWIQHLARVARRNAAGRTIQSFGVCRDITESKRAADALRNLSQRLIQAHEEERALLARVA